MLAPLSRLCDRFSRRPWIFVGAVALMVAVVAGMMLANAAIVRESGFPTFDSPDVEWTRGLMAQALAAYTPAAHMAHWAFTVLDMAFPFLMALVAAAIAGFGLRLLAPKAYEERRLHQLLPIFFIVTVLDWVENVAKQWLASSYPPLSERAADIFFLFNAAKSSAGIVMILAPISLILGLIAVIYRARANGRTE